MFQAVLQNAPDTWEESDYTGKFFILKEVASDSAEYTARFNEWGVAEPASGYRLFRVQNPFSYGRFALWKEQQGLTTTERKFYKSKKSVINFCIEYNYEERKTLISHYSMKNSLEAWLPLKADDAIHVLTCLVASRMHCDKNWYPTYVFYIDATIGAPIAGNGGNGDLDDVVYRFNELGF